MRPRRISKSASCSHLRQHKNEETMKTVFAILLCCTALAFSQAAALPTYVAAGAAFNQIASHHGNLFTTAGYPVSSSAGVYTSTTADVIPVVLPNPTGKGTYLSFQVTMRQGVHKVIYAKGKLALLLGGDAGAAFSQASPSGTNVNIAASGTGTVIYQINPTWGD